MRVLVTGGTGFIGAALCQALAGAGHTVTVVTRDPQRTGGAAIGWEGVSAAVRETDALVNLAGEPLGSGRWDARQKQLIRDSRVRVTRTLVGAVAAGEPRPKVLVNASAIGYYGPRADEVLDESAGPGTGFLADVCRAWEEAALAAEDLGLRVVRLRLGVVLAADGGALARMLPPFRAFLGGPIGSGRQWMSWIHRDDVTGLVADTLANESYHGAVNATAPQPVTNRDFARMLGRVLARPAWLPTPAFALRLMVGEMADLLLSGQRVLPGVADRLGYRWRFTELGGALQASIQG
ncbi:MAG TPA: TIGR01777 family oxidoreductase [Verrucomicrobiae bacterium]|nr:TIGR01777 family oxidoreductase [Verrucomicrobiae bacterium]